MNQTWILEAQVWNAGYRHVGYLSILFPTRREARRWARTRKYRVHDGVRLVPRPHDGEVLSIHKPFIGTTNRRTSGMRGGAPSAVAVVDGAPSAVAVVDGAPSAVAVVGTVLEYQIRIDELGWYHMGYGAELLHTQDEIESAQLRASEAVRLAYKRKIDSVGMPWDETRWAYIAAAHRCVPRCYTGETRDCVNGHILEDMKRAYNRTIKMYMAFLCGVDIQTMRLMTACETGDMEQVEAALGSGVVENQALFVACYNGRVRVVRLLLGHQKWKKETLITAIECSRQHQSVLDLVRRHL